jgi:pyruvate dehydrogenase E2 component (dihydrolipoamide acetyltransferase)
VGVDVIMPALGVAQESGRVLRWLKGEGEEVVAGEPLVEIETDKVTVELPAPASGVLASVSVDAGVEVPVGRVIALIVAPGGTPAPAGRASSARSEDVSRAPARERRASPRARRLAHELGVDLATVEGSGPAGAVIAADLLRLRETDPRAPEPALAGAVWRRMAERATASWTSVPHFHLAREIDAAKLVSWRDSFPGEPAARVTFTDLFVRIAAVTLRAHPRLNARWSGAAVVLLPEIGVGVAVATDDGLVVPVIHGADRLSVPEIAEARRDLVARARARTLRLDDVAGGTFTISNLGMYGIDAVDPIVSMPEAAILGIGRVAERVRAVSGRPVVRPTAMLTLACDHRVADGALAASFLASLAALAEEPAPLAEGGLAAPG